MPRPVPRLLMNLNHGNNISYQVAATNLANLSSAPKAKAVPPPTSLSAPIIARIHTVKPGCGGCGRH